MEMMVGPSKVTESKRRAMGLMVFDAALLAYAIAAPTIVITVYAMFLLNEHRPVSYPWQLVMFGSQSVVALAVRHLLRRLSPWRLAVFAVAFAMMMVTLILFVRSSADGLALAIERATEKQLLHLME